MGNLGENWRRKFKFCIALSISKKNYFGSFQNPSSYRRMKAVSDSELYTRTPEIGGKKLHSQH